MKEKTFEGFGSGRDEFLRRLVQTIKDKGFGKVIQGKPSRFSFKWMDASDPWSFIDTFIATSAHYKLSGYEYTFESMKSGFKFRVGVSVTSSAEDLKLVYSLIYQHTVQSSLKVIFGTVIALLVAYILYTARQYVFYFPFLLVLVLILYGMFVKPVKDTGKLIDNIMEEVAKSIRD